MRPSNASCSHSKRLWPPKWRKKIGRSRSADPELPLPQTCSRGSFADWTHQANSRQASLLFLLFLGCITAFHLWFIHSGRFNLAPDEAHYWTWSKRLDWSYYSKGPMVAYLIALSTRLGGDTEFFVRLPAVLLSTGTAICTFLLADRLYRSKWAGLHAVLVLAAMPLAEAGSILMTIDAPLIFFWSLTLVLIHRALEADGTGRWLLAGIGLGLGLLSKYTMAIMVPQTILYLVLSRHHRFWMRRPGPYLALRRRASYLYPGHLLERGTSFHLVAPPPGATWRRKGCGDHADESGGICGIPSGCRHSHIICCARMRALGCRTDRTCWAH